MAAGSTGSGVDGPVLLLSGFGAPSATLRPLAGTLRQRGMETVIAPLGLNLRCGEATVERLSALIEQTGTTTIVGHSRGGQLGLVAAVRSSQIRTLLTVGTPWSVGPPDQPGVARASQVIRYLRGRGVDLLPCLDCGTADCCIQFRADLVQRPRAHWAALWSSTDRVAGADSRPPVRADVSLDLRLGHLAMIRTRGGRDTIAGLIERGHSA